MGRQPAEEAVGKEEIGRGRKARAVTYNHRLRSALFFCTYKRQETMDLQIALLLGQDGIVNGAIYALLALA